jgi:glycosyltransferase involved in cell wall biosynthesis
LKSSCSKHQVIKGKVSVVLPVYFVKLKWLKQSISSVLGQHYSNLELIVVNDGAEENIDDLIKSFKIEKYIKNPKNMGFAYSLNKGFEVSDGEYLYKIDADDYILPGMISRFIEELEGNKISSIVWGLHTHVDDMDKILSIASRNDIAKRAKCDPEALDIDRRFTFFGTCAGCWLYRREVWEETRYNENLPVSVDFNFWIRASRKFKIRALPSKEPSYHVYRIHSNSMSGTHTELDSYHAKMVTLYQEALLYPKDPDIKRALSFWHDFYTKRKKTQPLNVAKRIIKKISGN